MWMFMGNSQLSLEETGQQEKKQKSTSLKNCV